MDIVGRIKQIIEYKNISTRKFCIEVGFANGFFDKVKDVGSEKLLKILNRYPEINPDWLLTGKGKMLLDEEETRINKYTISSRNDADRFSKALTWLFFKGYEKKTNNVFSFDSFSRLAEIFNLGSSLTKTIQESIETAIISEVAQKMITPETNLNDESTIIMSDDFYSLLYKYFEIYTKLETICLSILEILNDTPTQKEIFEAIKKQSLKNME